MEDLKTVKVFLHRYEAEEAKVLLESNGIIALVSADDCAGYRPDLKLGVALNVQPKDFQKAHDLLNGYVKTEAELLADPEYRELKVLGLKQTLKACIAVRNLAVTFMVLALAILVFLPKQFSMPVLILFLVGLFLFFSQKNALQETQEEIKKWGGIF